MDKKILIVEDDQLCREMYEHELKNHGYNVVSAEDGKTAVEKAWSEIPDLIMLDVMLPEMNGIDVLKEIRQKEKVSGNPAVPVMVMSNLAQESIFQQFTELGISGYLIKVEKSPAEVREEVEKFFSQAQ